MGRSLVICTGCGSEFSIRDSRLKAGRGKFCSKDCYFSFRKENHKDVKYLNKLYQKKNKYGLSESEYLELLQTEKCFICENEFTDEVRHCIDHDHSTGLVRGLLCCNCNSGLGFFNEDIPSLLRAAEYIQINLNKSKYEKSRQQN